MCLWDSWSRFALVIMLIVFLSLAGNMQSSNNNNNNNIVLGQTNNSTNQDSSSFLAKAVTINNNNTIISLSQPLYIEYFKIIGQKEVIVNKTKVTEEIFSGNGTTNGISVTSTGRSLIIPRAVDLVYVKGSAELIAAVDDRQTGKATYTYEAIGNYGIALFDANATGNLSFLSNTVGIYKVDMNKNGINIFTMWKWGND